MLTINIHTVDNETIHEAQSVQANYLNDPNSAGRSPNYPPHSLTVCNQDGTSYFIDHDCKVYVMSDGKTVAKYTVVPSNEALAMGATQ